MTNDCFRSTTYSRIDDSMNPQVWLRSYTKVAICSFLNQSRHAYYVLFFASAAESQMAFAP